MLYPKKDSLWIHDKSQCVYRIICVTNTNASNEKIAEFPATVVYERVKDETLWSRTLESFNNSFSPSIEVI